MTDSSLTVVPADSSRWDDVVELFGVRGDAAHCWCQWFIDSKTYGTPAARDKLHQEMHQSIPPGILAYQEGVPVGWLRISPLATLPGLTKAQLGSDSSDAGADTWCATCFVVKVGYRRHGMSASLLAAGMEHARSHGARRIIGRPVDLAVKPKVGSSGLFPGALSTYLAAGFHEVRCLSPHRVLVEYIIDEQNKQHG